MTIVKRRWIFKKRKKRDAFPNEKARVDGKILVHFFFSFSNENTGLFWVINCRLQSQKGGGGVGGGRGNSLHLISGTTDHYFYRFLNCVLFYQCSVLKHS